MITLLKTSIKTNKTKKEFLQNFEEVEKILSKTSTAHYNISNYSLTSTNFENLVKNFERRYNPNYFSIDYLLEEIHINKLKISEKRNLYYNKTPIEKEDVIQKTFDKIRRKHNTSYDEDLKILELYHEQSKVIFELDEDYSVKQMDIIKTTPTSIKEVLPIVNSIIKEFENLRDKLKREP